MWRFLCQPPDWFMLAVGSLWTGIGAFFWARGIWRNLASERWVGLAVFFAYWPMAGMVNRSSGVFAHLSGFVAAFGVMTMVVAQVTEWRRKRRCSVEGWFGFGLMLLGVLFSLIV